MLGVGVLGGVDFDGPWAAALCKTGFPWARFVFMHIGWLHGRSLALNLSIWIANVVQCFAVGLLSFNEKRCVTSNTAPSPL